MGTQMLSEPRGAATVANALAETPAAERVLVVRLGALGDVVRTRFAFAGLRALWPDARIDWLVEDRAAAGLAGLEGLDEAIVVPRADLRFGPRGWKGVRGLAARLRAADYDIAVDFHGIAKSAALVWAAGIPVRVGYAAPYARDGSVWLSTHRAKLVLPHISRFARNAALVEYLGGRVPDAPAPLALPPEVEVDCEVPDVVIHPGTSESTGYKRWPPEHFAAVARELSRAGSMSIVTWGPVAGEREAAEAVVAAAPGAARLAPPTASVGVLLALLRRARLFVGGDSGPLHLASLAGLPVVAVFGPTDPVENAPYPGLRSRIVREEVGCGPCREGCPVRSCLVRLDPVRVARAALELLGAA